MCIIFRKQCKISEECQIVDHEQPPELEVSISTQTVHTESTNEQQNTPEGNTNYK